MSPRNVIIFGATGAVGAMTALTAHQQGAKVSLAVRNLAKPIPTLEGISAQKVQADLSKPGTVKAAVQQTGATVAYLYAVFETQDYMRGGIESVVFLSSCSVEGDPRDVPESNFIANIHAKIEITLEEIFGIHSFVTLRPGFFTSNLLWFKTAILKGDVPVPLPEAVFDYIAPEDIGRVSGSILAHGSDQHIVRLFGAALRPIQEAFQVVGQALGINVKTTKVALDQAAEKMLASGIPEDITGITILNATEHPSGEFPYGGVSEGVPNIRKFTQREPVTLEQWVEANKDKFAA
ncbi:hypothetical protein N7468_007320 [Penicillium chermesinum]|uniref:NmrA-like domain-containing protein n=1 Tax=Penicillium chermesinum TaxID=63820 RepID=A0A9W9NTX4_9EURO|nr:uncharacterized protein N7468_007320 [Penicillium chermesinum]KAJ5226095.1 hypothetical protein N7468_007320 [Penicillium chermesinum]